MLEGAWHRLRVILDYNYNTVEMLETEEEPTFPEQNQNQIPHQIELRDLGPREQEETVVYLPEAA